MTDPVKEQLSACLDGELPEGELDLLLKQINRDPPLREAMGSYARIGEVMRAGRTVTASAGFAAKVSAAIAAEPQTHSQTVKPRIAPAALQWLRPAIGVAIAAGVAAVAVFSVQPDAPQAPQVAQVAEPGIAASSALTDASSYTVPTNTGATAFIPASATRLTNYVVAHSEYSSPLGRRTVLSGVLSDENALEESPAAAADGSNDGPINVNVEQPAGPLSR